MSQAGFDLFGNSAAGATVDTFTATVEGADRVYVKKLALNDWQWSEVANKHQAGVYIPFQDRDSGFFPKLSEKPRQTGAPIHEIYFDIHWPEVDVTQSARLVNYRSKGEETHLTNVPKGPFAGIAPASYLVIAHRRSAEGKPYYQAVVVDSASDECAAMVDLFEITAEFRSGLFTPKAAVQSYQDRILQFLDEASSAFRSGRLEQFSRPYASMPAPGSLAKQAREVYIKRHGAVSGFNPFVLPAPGDVVLEISRNIEHELFREYELRHRSLALVRLLVGQDPKTASLETTFRRIILEFPAIDKILLSAAQQRKSRAGYSFEHHIRQLLIDGGVPHEIQVVIEAKKRPDFVLPTFALYGDKNRPRRDALVLSAKTTLRERWKQVQGEIKNCDLYLATVDENIAVNAIEDMCAQGIKLVVPESLKNSSITAYKNQANVMSFKTFFMNDIKRDRFPVWLSMGLVKDIPAGQ